jgi:hypothetical protein
VPARLPRHHWVALVLNVGVSVSPLLLRNLSVEIPFRSVSRFASFGDIGMALGCSDMRRCVALGYNPASLHSRPRERAGVKGVSSTNAGETYSVVFWIC